MARPLQASGAHATYAAPRRALRSVKGAPVMYGEQQDSGSYAARINAAH